MRSLFTFLFLFIALSCIAQRKNVYLLKNDGTYVTVGDSADVIRIVTEPDAGSKLYNVAEYYRKSGKGKRFGKSISIDPPKFEGMVVSHYENGNRESINNYKTGKLTGDQYQFFNNNKPFILANYTGKTDKFGLPEFSLIAAYDSLGNTLVSEGNGYYRGYDFFVNKVKEEGPIKNGVRNGEWKYEDSLYTVTELFTDGKFISGVSVEKQNGLATTYTIPETLPVFKGGNAAFSQYLGENIKYPIEDRRNNTQGVVLVQFIIERDGKPSHIRVLRSVSPGMDKESIRVIERSPTWTPGTRFGRPVRATYTVPINFSLGWG